MFHVFLNRVQQTLSGNTHSQYSPATVSWTLFWCSLRGLAVSSKQCLEALPGQILQTSAAGHCLDTHGCFSGTTRSSLKGGLRISEEYFACRAERFASRIPHFSNDVKACLFETF